MPDQPNILFIVADQHRWDWLNCAGYDVPVRTPNVDALAHRGVLFNQCRCTSPLCAPSRASLATGMRPHRTNVPDNAHDLDTSADTFMKRLSNAGYRVAATGKTDLHKATPGNGLDGWTPRMGELGFTDCIDQAGKWDAVTHGQDDPKDPYMKSLHDVGLVKLHADDYYKRRADFENACWASPLDREHHTDEFCGRSTLKLLADFPRDQPWFCQVNFPGPHEPFDPPGDVLTLYDDVTFAEPVNAGQDKPRDHQGFRRAYAAMIEYIDEWVGQLIEAVDARCELDRTFIIYTSDHGEMLGDHGLWSKTQPHDPSVRVPCVIAGPGVQRDQRSDALIELSDFAALFVELAGQPVPNTWDARSFLPVLRGESSTHRDVTVSMQIGRNWKLITDGRWKLVENNGMMHLYDLQNDPHETCDIAGANQSVTRQLKQRLHNELMVSPDS